MALPSIRMGFYAFILLACVSLATATELSSNNSKTEIATFAGGCFWCMDPPFRKLNGVLSVTAGYTGGHLENPSYEQVSSGQSGHTEAVQLAFDPALISYEQLLDVYWRNIDPTVTDKQFCDVGTQYRASIFVHNPQQRIAAESSKATWALAPQFRDHPILTPIVDATHFYPAEDYHQDYARKNPARYKYYRWGCGRDQRLKAIWGKPPQLQP
jgi:peptide-methionine (S)-S-oxide reductase